MSPGKTAEEDLTLAGLTVLDVDEEQDFLNILIFGESGVGKTVLATSAAAVPSMAPVLVLNYEGGLLSAKQLADTIGIPKGALKTVRLNSFYEIEGVYNALREEDHPFRTVIIDSLTELQKASMDQIMTEVTRKDASRDKEIPAQRDWGKSLEQVRRIVRGYRDLPMHTIYTALAKEDKDEITGEVKVRPDLPGKLAGQVAQFMDEVFYMFSTMDTKDEEDIIVRKILTANLGKYSGKDRSGRLSTFVEDPSMKKLFTEMFGG